MTSAWRRDGTGKDLPRIDSAVASDPAASCGETPPRSAQPRVCFRVAARPSGVQCVDGKRYDSNGGAPVDAGPHRGCRSSRQIESCGRFGGLLSGSLFLASPWLR
ncbi:unnamed protein product [Urochloa humidicola]